MKLIQKAIPLILVFFVSITLQAQDTYVFFGSYNNDKTAEGIYVYRLDTLSGQLQPVTTYGGILNPTYLTLSPNGKYLYACTDAKTPNAGSVSSFAFNPIAKTLTHINSQPSGGENPVYLDLHRSGKWLVNGNYTQSSIAVHAISDSGIIQPIAQKLQFTEGSINPDRQKKSHIHATIFSPNHRYIFAPDLGADKIRTYKFATKTTPQLVASKTPFTQTTLGSGPRQLTFHPNGKFVYCIEELTGTVAVYTHKKGKFTPMQRISTHPDSIATGFQSSEVHVSPDGRFLYASNRGNENNIAIFSIGKKGLLTPIGYQSTLGIRPRVFAIDPSGKFLIATNLTSGNVFVFKRNFQTGLLTQVGQEVKVKGVSCVKFGQY